MPSDYIIHFKTESIALVSALCYSGVCFLFNSSFFWFFVKSSFFHKIFTENLFFSS
jgi:hypothetical protein